MPRLVLARPARAELLRLAVPLGEAIESSLGLLERDPTVGHPLRGWLRGLHSLHIGAYRIIFQLIDGGKTVRVVAIRHRSVAYVKDPR